MCVYFVISTPMIHLKKKTDFTNKIIMQEHYSIHIAFHMLFLIDIKVNFSYIGVNIKNKKKPMYSLETQGMF